ncbi:biotin/lipoyl-containing protein [Acetomicrobium sp.]|uniref:biotin/lipoyl-containing protein n=1 Tax=Acetomicrobium sp. TaxID=1872099 RepID=UPI002872160D|nr:biotin/lipoyl-containing protein [Acetomicrobium sp.]MDR9769892.1 biotin/lipoyl-containing protein [Acetomicrobium sp.]
MYKRYRIVINGREYEVAVEELGAATSNYAQASPMAPQAPSVQTVAQPPAPAPVPAAPAPSVQVSPPAPKPTPTVPTAPAPPSGGATISAPMPGKILKVLVQPGMQIKKGQNMLILEAMKMENEILAPSDGVVRDVKVKEGDNVNTGDPMVIIA